MASKFQKFYVFFLPSFGSGILWFFDPWIRNGKKIRIRDLGYGMNILDNISESLEAG
jgi:hypothetical protein